MPFSSLQKNFTKESFKVAGCFSKRFQIMQKKGTNEMFVSPFLASILRFYDLYLINGIIVTIANKIALHMTMLAGPVCQSAPIISVAIR